VQSEIPANCNKNLIFSSFAPSFFQNNIDTPLEKWYDVREIEAHPKSVGSVWT
jgi:hypothetical protein